MNISSILENKSLEKRIAITPEIAKKYIGLGFKLSLQKNYGVEQIKANNFEDKILDFSDEIDNGQNAFEDTISILHNVDKFITSDTAIAHLAATMDVKTYLLLSFSPDWRWHLELNKKCFYPNLTILKQSKFGDWSNVFKDLKKILI